MYVYAVLLAIGIFGIVGMALAGFVHIGPHSHAGHTGIAHGHGGHAGHGHTGHGQAGHGHTGHADSGHHSLSSKLNLKGLISFSPMDIFSYCAGAGLGAFLMRPYLQHRFLPIPAIIGALLFDFCVTRTIMATISKFGANPSSGLEGTVAAEGVAVTNFDSNGRGLVKLTLDGQIVQLLATLELSERNAGVRVQRGDSLVIVEVDSVKNTCKVTRELSQELPDHQVLRLEGKS